MSACIVALIVLGVMSIFSAKYRSWAREAFDCVARRLVLRPCRTGFNEKVRAKVTSKLMKKSPGIARIAHKHFEVFSWAFTIMLLASLAYSVYGFYNIATIGTCDPANPDQCIFNPDLPACGNPGCTGEDHCFCDGIEVGCKEQIFIDCDGDCACVCEGGDNLNYG
jgi:hypothetical protein